MQEEIEQNTEFNRSEQTKPEARAPGRSRFVQKELKCFVDFRPGHRGRLSPLAVPLSDKGYATDQHQ